MRSQVLLTWVLVAMCHAAPAAVSHGRPSRGPHGSPVTTSCASDKPAGWHNFSGIGPVSTNIPAAVSQSRPSPVNHRSHSCPSDRPAGWHSFCGIGPLSTNIPAAVPTTKPYIPRSVADTTTITSMTATAVVSPGKAPSTPPQDILADPKENVGIPTCFDEELANNNHFVFELGNFATEEAAMHLMDNILEKIGGELLSKVIKPIQRQDDVTWAIRAEISPIFSLKSKPVWEKGSIAKLINKETGKYPLIKKKQMEGTNACYAPESTACIRFVACV